MRRILFILMLCSAACYGQRADTIGNSTQTTVVRGGYSFMHYLQVPNDTNTVGLPWFAKAGRVGLVGGIFFYHTGTSWITPAAGGSVSSVNGQTGAVSLTTSNIPEETNKYFTDARVYTDSVVFLAYVKSLIGLKLNIADAATTYQPLLGYSAENSANKVSSFSIINNTLYPSTAAVNSLVNTSLAGYIRTSDSAAMLGNYMHRGDSSYNGGYMPWYAWTQSIAKYITAADTTHYNTAWLSLITGGSLSGGTLTLNQNGGGTVAITGFGSGSVTSLTGTANRITVIGSTTPQIDIASTYVGQASITTLGTIGTGTWQGTAIADGFIASAASWNQAYNKYAVSGAYSAGAITFTNRDGSTWSVTGLPSVYSSGYGLQLVSNIFSIDTAVISTRLWRQKVVDSLNALIALKQSIINLTTTGNSGYATFASNTLNIPTYTLSGLGGTPSARTLTINGVAADLSADRSFTVTDATLSASDITTNNSSTSQHGFLKKLTGTATQYMDGSGNWSTPAGSGTVTSVATSGPIAGGTITNTGTITFDYSYGGSWTSQQGFTKGINIAAQTPAPSTPASGATIYSPSNNLIGWRGQNSFSFLFDATALTGTRTATIPDRSFTLDNITTSTTTTLTAGSILFSTGTAIGQDNSSLFYNSTAHTLSVGTIATGVWNGTRLGSAYVPANLAYYDAIQSWSKGQAGTPVTLTDASTVALNLSLANNFTLVLGGNRTLGVPTNIAIGQSGYINVWQDNTGSRTLALPWPYTYAGGTAPTLSTAALKMDKVVYAVDYYATSTTVTATNATPGVFTWASHGLINGQMVQFSAGTTTTPALGTTYWITTIDANTFKISTSYANAVAGTFVTTTGISGNLTATACGISIALNSDFRR